MAAKLWLQHTYPIGSPSFHSVNTCHVPNNMVGTYCDSCNASHTQVSVSVAEHRELSSFSILELSSGRQLAGSTPASGCSAVSKGFQLCNVGGSEGPCVPLHTEEPLLQPRRLCKPVVTAPCYTLVGNFKQTSSKPEKHSGVCKCPSGSVYGAAMLYVTLWPLEQGASCRTGDCFVCLFGSELPIQRNTQT